MILVYIQIYLVLLKFIEVDKLGDELGDKVDKYSDNNLETIGKH